MKNAQAKSVLELLLNGVDPVTGECLDDDHVCAQPLVMRALHCAVEALSDAPRMEKTRKGRPANRPWTEEDDAQVCTLHEQGYAPEQICALIDRRPRGLRRRMEYLGLKDAFGLEGENAVAGLERAGSRWNAGEEEQLKELFLGGVDADEIAFQMRRSRYSIACRLEKLGLIEDREQLRK